jgi:hypothetical protein
VCVCCSCLQVGLFDFGSRSSPVVLLLDRNDDPVTPLLTQWTYQVCCAYYCHTLGTVCSARHGLWLYSCFLTVQAQQHI